MINLRGKDNSSGKVNAMGKVTFWGKVNLRGMVNLRGEVNGKGIRDDTEKKSLLSRVRQSYSNHKPLKYEAAINIWVRQT